MDQGPPYIVDHNSKRQSSNVSVVNILCPSSYKIMCLLQLTYYVYTLAVKLWTHNPSIILNYNLLMHGRPDLWYNLWFVPPLLGNYCSQWWSARQNLRSHL